MGKIRKILITGSSGTIGTRLFETLLARGYNVVGFDRKPNEWNSKLDKLTIKGDLLNKKDFQKIPNNFDLIVHLAANARVYKLVLKPELALENVVSTYNILDFARKNKIGKIIFSSSREVYGNRKKIVAKEDDVCLQLCESAYSASKISDETLIYSFSKCYGIDYIICRFSNVYGMYDKSERFMPIVIKDMMKNRDVKIFGKDKILDFTYIDDCISGIIKCIENFSKAKNDVFNIAAGHGERLADTAKIIKKELNSKSRIFIGKNRPGEVVKFIADISKAKKSLGYSPEYTLKKASKLTINWYKNLWR